MSNIFQKATHYFENELPFVIYCKPNSTEINGVFQQSTELFLSKDFSENGFVFVNFQGTQAIVFPQMECQLLSEKNVFANAEEKLPSIETSENGKDAFQCLVKNGIQAIESGSFEKVVLSRKETLTINDFSFEKTFEKMLSKYPTAFRYCWFHPAVGMWMGATPEQLLKIENSKFKTVALAGTQKFESDIRTVWEEKEKQEQQFVTDFITSNLKSEVDSLHQSEAYTFKAGNIVHIKTDIDGTFKSDFDLKKVIDILQPTPAVCGLPKEVSKDFILSEEGYDRKFYAGFLGEINQNQQGDVDLFVNLRCMEIEKNKIHLYIGCGITKDSNPEKEYYETANKAMTMKEILK